VIIVDNIPAVIGTILAKFRELENPETVSRAAAAAVLPELHERIHERGERPDGTEIGTYSNAYLALRKRSGKGSDEQVIISFTRMLQNGYTLQATPNGYTIGNISEGSNKKIEWMEERYGNIWSLSKHEYETARIAAEEESRKIMNTRSLSA